MSETRDEGGGAAAGEAAGWVGRQGLSDWHTISQEMVADYAALSGDGAGEWVHLDPARAAAELPYGGTIVQGFFQVAHLTQLFAEAMCDGLGIDPNHALNYGFDRLRFVNPLPVGAPFRARVTVSGVRPREGGGVFVTQDVTLEREDGTPTLVAAWLFFVDPRAFAAG
ncbi:MaoC/PaaZ C-terminal domain-containing protein [Aquibium sp. A9E412]|uniref:MaoC/PaaZ C-terminal domain-containing protein n=1 Tax=Aquibium sp. A9E412 TaxID=2976767 RepID=UPI0025AF0AD9|nr:MaoC/PaaZ C-terminal domain-containing protein [Aquibium sp. A9E412]MDN2567635.1 MaoC/PaaZ C-terminal domain-containing protein [Aquibium sp. A9E412]